MSLYFYILPAACVLALWWARATPSNSFGNLLDFPTHTDNAAVQKDPWTLWSPALNHFTGSPDCVPGLYSHMHFHRTFHKGTQSLLCKKRGLTAPSALLWPWLYSSHAPGGKRQKFRTAKCIMCYIKKYIKKCADREIQRIGVGGACTEKCTVKINKQPVFCQFSH